MDKKKKKMKIPIEIDSIPTIPFHKRKTRFILTLFLTVVISVTLVIGGFTSYFTMKGQSFITVDGKEILTPDVVQELQSQMTSLPIGTTDQEKMSQIIQAISGLQQNAMWSAFALQKGANFTASDIQNSLKDKYEEQKTAYEQKNNNYFPLNYNAFVNNSVNNFNTSSFYTNLITPSDPDYLTTAIEYTAQHTTSAVEYAYIDLKDYVAHNPTQEFASYYNGLKDKEITSLSVKVLPFVSEQKAINQNEAFDTQKDKKLKQLAFDNSRETLLIDSKKDGDAFTLLQNYKVDSYTVPFKYKGQFYLGKILQVNSPVFNDLTLGEKVTNADSYIKTLKKDKLDKLLSSMKDFFTGKLNLNVLQQYPFVHYGQTAPFNISKDGEIKDSQNKNPLPIGESDNNAFFMTSFKEVGAQSSLLQYKNIIYKIKVLSRENPKFPIDPKDLDATKAIVKDRENNMWYLYYDNKLKDSVKVSVNYPSISKLFNLK